jgi:hypothetical protein
VFQKHIPYPYNYMDIVGDDDQINSLIDSYRELDDTGIRKLVVNYEWSAYTRNDLMKKTEKKGFLCWKKEEPMPANKWYYLESEVASFIQFCPPSICEFNDFTVNFLKLLYAESYVNPNFIRAKVSYDQSIYLNSGIGGALKEMSYKSNRGKVSNFMYSFFKNFVGK